jgi:hypothetical protein
MKRASRSLRLRAGALLAPFLFCLSPTPAQAADWRLSAIRATRYGTSIAFLDISSIQGGRGQVSFAASTYFSRKTGKMNRVSVRVTASCSAMTYQFEEIVTLYNQRPLQRWLSIPAASAFPQTNIFDEIGSACGTRNLGNHVDHPEAFAARFFSGSHPRKRSFLVWR